MERFSRPVSWAAGRARVMRVGGGHGVGKRSGVDAAVATLDPRSRRGREITRRLVWATTFRRRSRARGACVPAGREAASRGDRRGPRLPRARRRRARIRGSERAAGASTAIGHSHPALVQTIAEQAGRLMQTTNLFYTVPQLDLCEPAARPSFPTRSQRCFFVSRGPRPMDGALKLRRTARRAGPKFVLDHAVVPRPHARRALDHRAGEAPHAVPAHRAGRLLRSFGRPHCARAAHRREHTPPSWSSRCRAKAASTSRPTATCTGCAI